uniref:Uncharacterized protein n=1 Tax=Lepeophtheirus salmonis TaxID=72036 RepID=A0A0K2TLG6_LEPSM
MSTLTRSFSLNT